ncbi:MAG: 50S ribosomal protein L15 [Alphaproteobacteria bacterium]
MKLNELKAAEGARHRKMRVGRGIGSGKGKTCGRGGKGQTARTGVAINGFEGGQTPLHRRLPKRGFNNYTSVDVASVNLSDVQQAIDSKKLDEKKPVDLAALKAAGLVRKHVENVKLLGNGELKSKVSFNLYKASASAKAAVEKAGGSLTLASVDKAEK